MPNDDDAQADACGSPRSQAERRRLQQENWLLRRQLETLSRELDAVETCWGECLEAGTGTADLLRQQVSQRRFLQVGGRPSSDPLIRQLIERHGGHYQRLPSRQDDAQGRLSVAVAWADWVLFPVDCLEREAAARLKQLCLQAATPFVPVRSATLASFASALRALADTRSPVARAEAVVSCRRHA